MSDVKQEVRLLVPPFALYVADQFRLNGVGEEDESEEEGSASCAEVERGSG